MSELGWPSGAFKRVANGLGWPKADHATSPSVSRETLVSRETASPQPMSSSERQDWLATGASGAAETESTVLDARAADEDGNIEEMQHMASIDFSTTDSTPTTIPAHHSPAQPRPAGQCQ